MMQEWLILVDYVTVLIQSIGAAVAVSFLAGGMKNHERLPWADQAYRNSTCEDCRITQRVFVHDALIGFIIALFIRRVVINHFTSPRTMEAASRISVIKTVEIRKHQGYYQERDDHQAQLV